MIHSLSTDNTLRTLQALAAVEALGCAPGERAVLAPLLDGHRRQLAMAAVHDAFVAVAAALVPWATDVQCPQPDDSDTLMTVTLPDSPQPLQSMLLTRSLEQAVALTALERWAAAHGGGARMAQAFGAVAARWLDTLAAQAIHCCDGVRPSLRRAAW